jgi:hypothetical protein
VTWINSGAPGESVDSRTIRQLIYLGAEDGPAIHTPAQDGLHGWEPGVTGWFVAPSGLRDTLAELAVPISAASSFSERPLSEASADGAQPERDPAGANSYAVAGFALVGLAAALVVRRMLEWRVRRCP